MRLKFRANFADTDNMRLKWMLIGQLVLVLFIYVNISLWAGSYIDSICVEGRLSDAQAVSINAEKWDKCPNYRMRENGKCEAEIRDRVVKHYCSAWLRKHTGRDATWMKHVRRRLFLK